MGDETDGEDDSPPPAGWYVDAFDTYRWWDGARWTVHTIAAPQHDTVDASTDTDIDTVPKGPAPDPEPQPVVARVAPPEPGSAPMQRTAAADAGPGVVDSLTTYLPKPHDAAQPAGPDTPSAAQSAAASPRSAGTASPRTELRIAPTSGRRRHTVLVAVLVVLALAIITVPVVLLLHGRSDTNAADPAKGTTGTTGTPATTPATTPPTGPSPTTSPPTSASPTTSPTTRTSPTTSPTTSTGPANTPSAVARDLFVKTFARNCSVLNDMTKAFQRQRHYTPGRCRSDPHFFGKTDITGCRVKVSVPTPIPTVKGEAALVRYVIGGDPECFMRGKLTMVKASGHWKAESNQRQDKS